MFDFPASPTLNQVYNAGSAAWRWNGYAWIGGTGGSTGGGILEAPVDGKQYAREDASWSEVVIPAGDWGSITGKPTTFPPSAHTHPTSEVTGLDAAQTAQDGAISAASGAAAAANTNANNRVAKGGDTMTGFLTLHADPDAAMKAATKQYVDAKVVGAAISDTAPSSPVDGQLWWRSTDGVLFIRFNDGNSTQWVEA